MTLVVVACIYLLTWVWGFCWWAFDLQISGQLTAVLFLPYLYTTNIRLPGLLLRILYLHYKRQMPAEDANYLNKALLNVLFAGLSPYALVVVATFISRN